MPDDNAKVTRLLDEVESAKTEANELYQEALRHPNKVVEQRMWEAMDRQRVAMRAVLDLELARFI